MPKDKINVTKTFLPPSEQYYKFLDKIWSNGQLTNQGPLLKEFENKTSVYLNVKNFHFVSNGTIALQIALKALGIEEGEIITTPFSYVATTSAILWERCEPVYVDIDPDTLNIDPTKIEQAITPNTKAILAVHVFGNPCDVEEIDKIAKKHKLKVIYDGAHAFGAKYKGKSLLSYGDISTCSFHATKLFHTIEGGCVIAKEPEVSKKLDLIKRFGHYGDDHIQLGINAKASEFQAAMGLVNLKYISEIIKSRSILSDLYDTYISLKIKRVTNVEGAEANYAYYPVIFKTEKMLLACIKELNSANIYPRRYFYPSLNKLPYLKSTKICDNSEDISSRIICLPFYSGITEAEIKKICKIINKYDT
jgi:dTDP-4-amino-4,6-dideoxygalactose transaminase